MTDDSPLLAAVGINDDWQTAGITWAGFEPTGGQPALEGWVRRIDRQDDGTIRVLDDQGRRWVGNAAVTTHEGWIRLDRSSEENTPEGAKRQLGAGG